MRPALYIPNHNGAQRLAATLESLRAQSRPVDVVVADNGSTDGSLELLRERFSEVDLVENGANLGFGPALNRAAAEHPGDPMILLNNDAVAAPRFVEALLDAHATGAESVAGVLTQERDPRLIDSAGVVADRTLMGFDYLHGEPLSAAAGAADPLGPTGGAALYSKRAFDAVGGFDERIFLYYEDLDLALRIAAAGARCQLAPAATAVHAYSASLGARSGAKFARTGWSRGYMLRRYGVMRRPSAALRALTCEAVLCAGQIVSDRSSAGLRGRIRGWRDGGGLAQRQLGAAQLLDISAAQALALRRRRHAD
jgi:GT2 family glycosyltransferase